MRLLSPLRFAAVAALAVIVAALGVALDVLFPFPFERLARPQASFVAASDGRPLRLFLARDEIWRLPVTLDDVAPELLQALVASEDRWFEWHPGVNPLSVVRAAWTNLRAGRVVSGASTIPMQLARLAESRPRTLRAKLIEAFRALQLVAHLPRERILELYLNRAPFGGNLEGVGAASYFYFGKRPDGLATGEIALLVALPRAPAAFDPVRHPERARAARDRVLRQLHEQGLIPERLLERARRQPLPRERRRAPFEAPHFARWVQEQDRSSYVVTTIDRRIQRISEALVGTHVEQLRWRSIDNAAIVVIENEGRELRALVGSADFFDSSHAGQVDGARARRSPGSTLKPFLYALAFDLGLLIPDSYVLDVPIDFAGYVAENYDGRYRGRTTVREALVHSLNAPAVATLADIGLQRFHSLLMRGGLTTLDRPVASYGLPLVLGAGEVTLVDLTNLYATLAAGGLHSPVRWTEAGLAPPTRLLSRDAAQLVARILTELERPDMPRAWRLTRDVPAVAWKTGTSYGHRDAWAVGFSGRYSIGVWVGNFDGRARPGISGAEHAGPLLFDLFGALERSARALPDAPGPRTHLVRVCALSHELPGPFCDRTVDVPFISGTSELRRCSHHRRIFVDPASGRRIAGGCLAARPHRPAIIEVFPDPLVRFWRASGRTVPGEPPLHPSCREVPGGAGPRIVSPAHRTPYRLRADAPLSFQRVQLAADVAPGTTRLYWYRDGLLVGSSSPEQPLFVSLSRGPHRMVVVDDAGRMDETRYEVE